MAVTNTMGRKAKYLGYTGAMVLNDATAGAYKALLTTSAFAYDPDTHNYVSQVTNELGATGGYARKSLTNVALSEIAGNKLKFTSDKLTWAASGAAIGPWRRVVIFKDTGTAATSPIVCVVDAGADITIPDGTSYDVTPDATNGWLG